MQHQPVTDVQRWQLDRIADDIDVHAQTTIELDRLGWQRDDSRWRHADLEPRRQINQMHPGIDGVAAKTIAEAMMLAQEACL